MQPFPFFFSNVVLPKTLFLNLKHARKIKGLARTKKIYIVVDLR